MSLFELSSVRSLSTPVEISKRDRRGWVVVHTPGDGVP
ncbi:hypothetical protein DB30_03840 [Enhygromyxa salina]|uniref:Uncharacterized protein n=1 Tax=Enhygromyxa salina TaxID=215803 RepID=A0A0C1ZP36_9BACT|nr:hypothetical protein DB30_03840 [Enhygromyxa salina]